MTRETRLELEPGRDVGRGSVEAVPGTPLPRRGSRRVFGPLRADHHRARRIEDFLTLLPAGEIALHRGAGAELVGAQQGLEGGADLGHQVGFDLVAVIERCLGSLRTVQRAGGLGPAEQVAVHIQDRDRVGRKPFHGARHQVVDGLHVCGRQPLAGTQLHQDAGLGRLLRFQEDGILGEGDVNARLLHFRQRHDRPLQFAFERSAVVDMLGEFGGAEVGLVEQLEADPAGLRQPGSRHLDAQLRQAGRRDQHGSAVLGEAVLHTRLLELLHDGGGVFRRDAGEQRLEIGFALPAHEGPQSGQHQHCRDGDADALPDRKISQDSFHASARKWDPLVTSAGVSGNLRGYICIRMIS